MYANTQKAKSEEEMEVPVQDLKSGEYVSTD